MLVDNRWTTDTHAPDDATAIYSARWIDNGDMFDIVPDRQGFAYDDALERARLQVLLGQHEPHKATMLAREDRWQCVIAQDEFTCLLRRWGGYVYVDAWITRVTARFLTELAQAIIDYRDKEEVT